jgi:hypothetical protein
VPLIRALGAAGHEVIPCASGAGLRLLQAEFPGLQVRALPSYAMRYTRHRALLPVFLLLQLPLFLLSAWRDGRAAARIARETGAGLIVSDGRYGFRVRRGAPSASFRPGHPPAVFITHQLDILPPGPRALRALLTPALRAINRRALRGFAELWVPDFPGPLNLSGALGHPPAPVLRGAPPVRYIRPLCRFRPDALSWSRAFAPPVSIDTLMIDTLSIDTLALLSGPEPQRSLLEALLVRAFADLPGTRVIVRGVPGPRPSTLTIRPGALNVFDHLSQEPLLACLANARRVVCRSGYTTMMELAGLGQRRVLLVPTPGQPEQESLAVHARAVGLAAWRDQEALEAGESASVILGEAFGEAEALTGFPALFAALPDSFDLADWISKHPLLSSKSV